MKRIISLVLSIAIAMVSLQGCYGKMALTRKIYQANGSVHDKYLRSLVSWVFVIVPVYGVSALADFILFNTIEFWSGTNPVAEGEKSFRYAENGEGYRVNAKKSGDTVTYVVDRYRGERHIDTLSIEWNTKSGNSTAQLVDTGGAVTHYQAVRDNGSVRVSSTGPGSSDRIQAAAANYR